MLMLQRVISLQACEQLFAWLSQYKGAVRHMKAERFLLFICRMCHLKNCQTEAALLAAGKELHVPGETADITMPPVKEPLRRRPFGMPPYLDLVSALVACSAPQLTSHTPSCYPNPPVILL